MYKVFIDNAPKTFEVDTEDELLKVFDDHTFIQAAGGLVRRGTQFLFIKRHGKWDIPKGKLDPGESVEQCAIREIEEECGLIAPTIIDHLTDSWHTYETAKGKKVLKKTFWYVLDEGEAVELVPQTEEGITELDYYSLEDFDMIRANTFESIIEVMDELVLHLKT